MRLAFLSLLLALPVSAPATGTSSVSEESTRPLDGFAHTAWTAKDGSPSTIYDLAQTADGTLWLASDAGLYQFDGLRFTREDGPPGHPLPASVFTVFAPPTGGLWLGPRFGGAIFLKDGKVREYAPGSAMPK